MIQQSITLKAGAAQIPIQVEIRRFILQRWPIAPHRFSSAASARRSLSPVMGILRARRDEGLVSIATLAMTVFSSFSGLGSSTRTAAVIGRGGFQAGLGRRGSSGTLTAVHWAIPGLVIGEKWIISLLRASSRARGRASGSTLRFGVAKPSRWHQRRVHGCRRSGKYTMAWK